MLIRRETAADVPAVRDVTAAAFARPGTPVPVEVTLLDGLRTDPGWLPTLSLVAVAPEGAVVGHVVCTRGHVGDVPVLGLGPVSVRPDHQRRGTGTGLVHAVLGAAEALGEPLVALLGDPAFYGRFGFRTSTEYGVTPPAPDWGAYFQARTLTSHDPAAPVRGEFTYAAPFAQV